MKHKHWLTSHFWGEPVLASFILKFWQVIASRMLKTFLWLDALHSWLHCRDCLTYK